MAILSLLTSALAFSSCVLGHVQSQDELRAEARLRSQLVAHSKRSLGKCSDSPAAVALKERAILRRAATVEALRAKRGLKPNKYRRDLDSLKKYLTVSHDMTSAGYDLDTPLSTVFGSNATCALVPETTIGPYYVEGELIRSDITDGEPGVASHLDFQFIDINTCEPVPRLLIDVWHCNATGAYSGVSAPGQGGLTSTFGRGVQTTDSDGVVQFDTIFPGHYAGRASHFHVMSTANAIVLDNGTFTGGDARHIGQTYFDDSLREAVEALKPYSSNTGAVTSNEDDKLSPDEASAEYDPFMKYVQLGDGVSDGLLLWITIGIDPTANYNDKVTPVGTYHPDSPGPAQTNDAGGWEQAELK